MVPFQEAKSVSLFEIRSELPRVTPDVDEIGLESSKTFADRIASGFNHETSSTVISIHSQRAAMTTVNNLNAAIRPTLDPEPVLSPKELAEIIGLSESTLKRWVDSGVLHAAKTPGGHRRIARSEAVRLIRTSNLPVLRPDMLGVPDLEAIQDSPTQPGLEGLKLYEFLREGQDRHVRGLLLSQYLAGRSIIEICDGPVREAMHRIGELWHHSESGIYQEHRASDIIISALNQLRLIMPQPSLSAPLAIGGAPGGDPYLIPSLIAAIVLESSGFRTHNLGPDLPLSSLYKATEELKPVLVWLSVSATKLPAETSAEIARLADQLKPLNVKLIVGGQQREFIPTHEGVVHAYSMGELVAFAKNLAASNA